MVNKESKLVSIIIPTYNRDHLISETLNSVMSQTYINWECIVVDDGSTDNTLNILKDFGNNEARIKLFKRPENKIKGANACRNIGIENARGKYVIFLDADDLLSETCLEIRLVEFEKNKDLDFMVFSMGHFEKKENLYLDENRVVFNGSTEETIKQFLTKKFPWNTTRPIYKISTLKKNKGFNENLMRLQDPEMALRLLLTISDIKYKSIDITDCYYRIDEDLRKKYKDKQFILKIVDNLMILFQELPLDSKHIVYYKKDLVLFFIGIVISYSKYIDYSYFKKALKVLNKILNLDLSEIIKLKLFFFLKRNENKKGTYKLLQLVKRSYYK